MPCFFHSGNVYLSIQREEARVCEGYRLCTFSEHGAPGQESSTVTLEKSEGRARTDSLPQAVLGPRPCSPLTHRVLPLPQYPLCPPQTLMQGITSRFEFNRKCLPCSPLEQQGGNQDLQSSNESAAWPLEAHISKPHLSLIQLQDFIQQ